jgi:alkaline phosphatase D
MWDDHEVRDNWYHDQILPDQLPYTEKRVRVLAGRARQAFLESYPITIDRDAGARIYRSIPFGPHLEVFALDMRSERGANSENMQPSLGPEAAILGQRQLRWLIDALTRSQAAWKIVAADMPLGVTVSHQRGRHDAVSNGDPGAARGRELEIAALLSALKKNRVRNVVWITADVHYCAAHHYDPGRAAAKDFDPFWEFVAGPAHAGTFAPGPLDGTFGPELRFSGTPADLKPNRPPDAGLQFFGLLETDGSGRELTVSLRNTTGRPIFTQQLERV